MGVCTHGKASRCMADQSVNAHLIYAGAVQKGSKCMPAVMGRMVCTDSNSFKRLLEQLCVSHCANGAVIERK